MRTHLDYWDVIYHNQRDDFMKFILSKYSIRPPSLFPGVGRELVVRNYTMNLVGNP